MVHVFILRLPEVISRTGLSRSSIYSAIKARTFPTHISIGVRSVGWLSTDIDAWIACRLSASRQASK
jgi:prophage regulatory protein